MLFACGLAACGTDPAVPADAPPVVATAPSISGVVPDRVFLGRDARIEISGDATQWVDGTTVSFGAGVTVHAVAVASPTSLFADVTVGDTAGVGLSDVVVTGADGMLALHGGLAIEPPLHIDVTGTLAQGSIVTLHVTNHDFDHPFDTSSTTFGGAFPDLDIEPPPGTSLEEVVSASAFDLVAIFTVDVDAEPGELVINSGPTAHALRYSAGTLAVAPRTPISITPNTLITGGAVGAFDTVLYELTPAAAPAITEVDVDNGAFTLLPASGHFAESFSSSPIGTLAVLDPVVLTTDKFYVIYGGVANSTVRYELEATAETLAPKVESPASNDTAAHAQVIQQPALFGNGTLSSATDVDFVTFPVDAADIGKTVRVLTVGDVATVVDVFADEAGTIELGESAGGSFDDFTSRPIPEGTQAIYVRFSAAGDVDPALNVYLSAIYVAPVISQ
jgi:hypothetical protein